MLHPLYTIGYAAFSAGEFLRCLKRYGIGAVVDVRSQPKTSHFETYRFPAIRDFLRENEIHYLSMAEALGARPKDRRLYTEGRADFKKIAASQPFLTACARIKNGLGKFPVCLMCAQKDPLQCHRSVLITHNFRRLYPEASIFHIISQDEALTEQDLDLRLLKLYGCDQLSLSGQSEAETLAEAYQRQERRIAYTLATA